MTKDEALKLELEALEDRSSLMKWQEARDAVKEALAQPEQEPVCPDCKAKVLYECVACSSNNYPPKTKQEPVTIWYMRDNHTFKKLSADVSIALIEIEQEFNEGYTYGMLCSKRKGFPNVHASGEKKRLEFFAECKKTLEEWLPNTTPPQREPKPFFTEANGFPQGFVPKDRHKVEQEPTWWLVEYHDWAREFVTERPEESIAVEKVTPLYTSPQRTWQGLTHEQVDSWELPDCPTVFEFAQFIEAKLKQKNGFAEEKNT